MGYEHQKQSSGTYFAIPRNNRKIATIATNIKVVENLKIIRKQSGINFDKRKHYESSYLGGDSKFNSLFPFNKQNKNSTSSFRKHRIA